MELTTKKTVLILTLIAFFGIALAPAGRAAHATNFLDPLFIEVTNRLNNTNLSAPDRQGLTKAANSLSRDTRTLAADLTALSSAAKALERQFPSNVTFIDLGNDAVDAYSVEAHEQLNEAELRIGTNSIPKGWSNQLAQVMTALTNADAVTNGVSARAKALAQVFNRLQPLVAKIVKRFPTIPVAPFEAPTEMATGQNLTLYENAIVNDQTIFYFHTTSGGGTRFLHYTSHNPEELGRWTYERTASKAAVVHCQVDFTQVGATRPGNTHDISLTFTSATTGTFTAVNCFNEAIQGTFVLE